MKGYVVHHTRFLLCRWTLCGADFATRPRHVQYCRKTPPNLKQGPQTQSRRDTLHFGFAYWAREPSTSSAASIQTKKDHPQFVSTQVINAPELVSRCT